MQAATNPDPQRVDAAPAKRFFVSMLVKDIELVPSIVDLVDNSIDGAKRIRSEDQSNRYEGLRIDITVDRDHFLIEDNCGGMEAELARRYAFRFGRPEEYDGPPDEVGQFGVGMKRALFKLGTRFRVDSTATYSRFSLPISVPEWMDDTDPDWTFCFAEVEEGLDVPAEERKTRVEGKRAPSFRRRGARLGALRNETSVRAGAAADVPAAARPLDPAERSTTACGRAHAPER